MKINRVIYLTVSLSMFLTFNSLFSQNILIGDTINFLDETAFIEEDIVTKCNITGLKDYIFVESGFNGVEIGIEIFILKKDSDYLVLVTEMLDNVENTPNLVIGQINIKLKAYQRVMYHMCFYENKENPDIIAVVGKGYGKTNFDIVVKAWIIDRQNRKVEKVDVNLVGCSFDLDDYDNNEMFEIKDK